MLESSLCIRCTYMYEGFSFLLFFFGGRGLAINEDVTINQDALLCYLFLGYLVESFEREDRSILLRPKLTCTHI